MGLRTVHGTAAKHGIAPVLETKPADETPAGMPDDAGAESPGGRQPDGRFAPGNPHAAKGGRRKAGKTKLSTKLGIARELPDTSTGRTIRAQSETFRRVETAHLAQTVGGGFCGPAPSSFIASGALALGWSRHFYDAAALILDADPVKAAKLVETAARLAEASSKALREAHEYCAREASARAASRPAGDAAAQLRARLLGDGT